MNAKQRRRLKESFLFRIRAFRVSIADVVCLFVAVALTIYLYRYLNVGWMP